MQLTLTSLADASDTLLPPDIVWNGYVGDFAVSAGGDDGAAGGLVAANPLRTAVILLLFTDARAETYQLRFEHRGDRRGWPGDGFDVDTAKGEAPLGSLLWTFRRHELNDRTAMEVAAEAERALQPLLGQQAVVAIRTKAVADKGAGRIVLTINLYGRDGRDLYAPQFDLLWSRADGGL